MFLPVTLEEARKLGWDGLDVVLVTGDAYIDSPYIGVAVIGHWLVKAGFTVGVIPQPDPEGDDLARLGEPRLFWGVTGGSVDSMVANTTATLKRRKHDDLTPGGLNTKRPDRAVIRYANAVRRLFKGSRPIVLGGIEASLRRLAHYDYWEDRVRRSILFDAKADYLVYGMGERAVVELAKALREGRDPSGVRGICFPAKGVAAGYLELPPYEQAARDPDAFTEMFKAFYANNEARTARGLAQRQDTRWLVQTPPAPPLKEAELDAVHDLPFEWDAHPVHRKEGAVKALETIRFSIPTHRGCFGECNFCAIAVHQGKVVASRSEGSILKEAEALARLPGFKGNILDVGGPTANMYGMGCDTGGCGVRRCLSPQRCRHLRACHQRQVRLLERLRAVPGVKKVFVASGIRYDLVMEDATHGGAYLEALAEHHVSGQLKVAPEHNSPRVLAAMGKPDHGRLLRFRESFERASKRAGKRQFLTYYFIAAHPGCSMEDMEALHGWVRKELKLDPEQVQVFTPTPSTWSALMYWTEQDPWSGERLFVEKGLKGKQAQKEKVTGRAPHGSRPGRRP
jgi:uncharacterized radical SAM protein YgiQ